MSSSTLPPVVFYVYDASPFGNKINNLLSLVGVAYNKVEVPRAPPRTALRDFLGLHYRRIPVLAIGRDVYVDTSLIASTLARRFTPAHGEYDPVFPPRKDGGKPDTGMVKAFAMAYTDRTVFGQASTMLPWDTLPEPFVKDRSSFLGADINPKAMVARQSAIFNTLECHIGLTEEQLSDGREWLFDTVTPGYADICVHFIYAWIQPFPSTKGLFDSTHFPYTAAWIGRMTAHLESRKSALAAANKKLTDEEAAKLVVSSAYERETLEFDEAAAKRWGLSRGMRVSVAPDDVGRNVLSHGKLVGFTLEEVVLETTGSAGTVRCHFPRLFFTVKPAENVANL